MDTNLQRVLTVKGYGCDEAGVKAFQKSAGLTADGIVGPKTTAALLSFKRRGMLTTDQKRQLFGDPATIKNLARIALPFPQRVAWDLSETVTAFDCHKLIRVQLLAAYTEILAVYGLGEIQRLGIDLWGGCYNPRKMRGGNEWSSHAWGIAVDQDPDRNQLRETDATARFARPEYAAMVHIFYKHGFVSQGVEKNFDWMHFEAREVV